jgi:transposase
VFLRPTIAATGARRAPAEKAVREIRRKIRRRFSAEERIRIVIEGLRGEESVASLVTPTRCFYLP